MLKKTPRRRSARAILRCLSQLVGVVALSFPQGIVPQTSPSAPNPANNADLTNIYNEDQRVRSPKPLTLEERSHITRTDADRLQLVKQMIATDTIKTTADYRHAAFIVQHSLVSSDYLLAHSLAVVCAADVDKTCAWLSAATLDRYLQSINQPQIYGTQFAGRPGAPITQAPYNSDLITDSVRRKLGVPTVSDQASQLETMIHRATNP